jgi:eukaryotic-like serine/threonine-protein kinase
MTAVPTLTPSLADRYTVVRPLGAGGMATVYLARERFTREIRTAARLAHPHILPLFDSGEADGLLFFVMPVMEGQTLRTLLDVDGRHPVETAATISSPCPRGAPW